MKRTVQMALMVSLLLGTAAMAHSADNSGNDRGRGDRNSQARDSKAERREERRDDRHDSRDNRRDDRRDSRDNRRDDRRDWRDDRRDDRRDWRNDRRDDRRDWRDNRSRRYWAGEYRRPPGYYVRQWRRGDRLPHAFRGRTYIVHDYHGYRLRRPPRGHHWVRVNHDVILTAIATGIVLDVIYNHFH